MRRPWRSFRALTLILTACFHALWGYALLISPTTAQLQNGSYAFHLFSPTTWGWIWIATAATCLVGSVFENDWIPFAAGTLILGAWAGFYVVIWLEGNGLGKPWLSAAFFVIILGFVVLYAGREDEEPFGMTRRRGGPDVAGGVGVGGHSG